MPYNSDIVILPFRAKYKLGTFLTNKDYKTGGLKSEIFVYKQNKCCVFVFNLH